MKTERRLRHLSRALLLGGLMPAVLALHPELLEAQMMSDLVTFDYANSGPANPEMGLALQGGTLFGTTLNGGSNSVGTIFSVRTNGTGYTNIFNFPGDPFGANPCSNPLVVSNGLLYGATQNGGNGSGTIFRINTNGSGYTNLYSFTARDENGFNTDGAYPGTGLVLRGNTLFGATTQGGTNDAGVIFRLGTDGSGFTNLHTMRYGEGVGPSGIMVISGDTLYGTAPSGGPDQGYSGVIFKINTDGSGFTNVYTFSPPSGPGGPSGRLVLSGPTLYGTLGVGGSNGVGTVFRVDTNGLNFTNLFTFPSSDAGYAPYGAIPASGLAISGNTLYGTTQSGGTTYGAATYGVIFAISTDGSGFTNLFFFDYNVYGQGSPATLLVSGNTLYGTTDGGGAGEAGTVFALGLSEPAAPPLPIPLNISLAGSAAVLSWTNSAFSLWSSGAVSGPYTNVPGATSPYTNTSTDPSRFFRLHASY
jgi:uncharacterized repeat protein (TIGR03803 family)